MMSKSFTAARIACIAVLTAATNARADDRAELSPDRPGIVRLHIDANVPDVELRLRLSGGGSRSRWPRSLERPVCSARCDQVIDFRDGRELHFAGDVWDAPSLQLGEYQGDVTVRLTARPRLRNIGIALIVPGATGITLAVVGRTKLEIVSGKAAAVPSAGSFGVSF
jgi:hypothetical protein